MADCAYNARYIFMRAKVLHSSGEAWVPAFDEQAEALVGVGTWLETMSSEMRDQVRDFGHK